MKKIQTALLFITCLLSGNALYAQDAMALVLKVKAKLDKVNDYKAVGKLKTDVAFLKVPVATVNIFYKKPDKFRISKEKGISILPKGGVSVNMQNVLTQKDFIALDAGVSTVGVTAVKVVKLLPSGETGDVVLTTLYIDEANLLIRKAVTTTRENGTYEVEMTYGKWAAYALPDKTIFKFNTKDYKLPKGVTMEFDDGERPDPEKMKNKKGYVEITFQSYDINNGVPDSYFSK